MSDPYLILGVSRSASEEEIRKAYRKLAMEYHPDRGGDQEKFKEVTSAYEQIKHGNVHVNDPFSQDGFNTRADFGDFSTVFETHFNRQFRQKQSGNRDVNIVYNITLEEVFTGVNKDLQVNLPGGRKKVVNIEIPAGIKHGDKIKFPKLGDDAQSNFTPGDLYVTIKEQKHTVYQRIKDDCHVTHSIPVKIAMTGGHTEVKSIDGSAFKLTVKPGTQPGTKLRIPEAGFPIYGTKRTGNLIVVLNVVIPAIDNVNTTIEEL
jgi:DnaJ-class molecular chaperone